MPKRTARYKALIAVFVAHCIWGGATPIVKMAFEIIPPISMAVLRCWFTTLILLLFLIIKKQKFNISKKDLLPIAITGLFAIPIHIGLYFVGLSFSNSLYTSVIMAMTPMVTAVTALAFHREKIAKPIFYGIMIAFFGSLFVIGQPLLLLQNFGEIQLFIGNMILLLSVISYVIGAHGLKSLTRKYDPVVLTTVNFALGFFVLLPFAFNESRTHNIFPLLATTPVLIGLIYVVLLSSITAYLLYTFALKSILATEAEASAYIMPVVGIILSYFILGEQITLPFITGTVIIGVGVFFAESGNPYHPFHKHVRAHQLKNKMHRNAKINLLPNH